MFVRASKLNEPAQDPRRFKSPNRLRVGASIRPDRSPENVPLRPPERSGRGASRSCGATRAHRDGSVDHRLLCLIPWPDWGSRGGRPFVRSEVIDLVDRLTPGGSILLATDDMAYVDQAWRCWAATWRCGAGDRANRGGVPAPGMKRRRGRRPCRGRPVLQP